MPLTPSSLRHAINYACGGDFINIMNLSSSFICVECRGDAEASVLRQCCGKSCTRARRGEARHFFRRKEETLLVGLTTPQRGNEGEGDVRGRETDDKKGCGCK